MGWATYGLGWVRNFHVYGGFGKKISHNLRNCNVLPWAPLCWVKQPYCFHGMGLNHDGLGFEKCTQILCGPQDHLDICIQAAESEIT